MRMRKKKNLIPRMERCGDFLIRDPYDRRGNWRELMPQVELDARPRRLIGTNTPDCLQSGLVYGTAAMLDGMAGQFREALGAPDAPVIATGQLPAQVRAACRTPIEYRETLVLDGLYAICKKNSCGSSYS